MARPQKQTVEYFSHDANASQGRTLSVLYNHFGHEGISAWWLLLEQLAATRNHFVTVRNGEDTEFLAAKMHFKPNRLKEILAKLVELEAIDRGLFSGEGIVWCQNFVDRLETVYQKRGQSPPRKPELSTPEMPLSTPEMPLSTPEMLQRKESKGKRVKERKESTPPNKKTYGEFNNVLLADGERKKLADRFGESDTQERIERLSGGIASKGYKYKSHYATILNWDRKDKQEDRNGGRKQYKGMPGMEPAHPRALAFLDEPDADSGAEHQA
jgi:hypothetical protein